MDLLFEIKVKQAFSKIKEDISKLNEELSEYKTLLKQLIDRLSPQDKTEKPPKIDNFSFKQENTFEHKKSSIGNKGVCAFTHSLIHSPFTHLCTHSGTKLDESQGLTLPSQDISTQIDINHPLQTLTNREFLVFLTIYQLEKELPRVTYEVIAKKLSLTSGCIRTYITSLIRKKAPIIKSKLNNKLTILSIDKSFRSLTSEQKLINIYYQNNTYQSTLT